MAGGILTTSDEQHHTYKSKLCRAESKTFHKSTSLAKFLFLRAGNRPALRKTLPLASTHCLSGGQTPPNKNSYFYPPFFVCKETNLFRIIPPTIVEIIYNFSRGRKSPPDEGILPVCCRAVDRPRPSAPHFKKFNSPVLVVGS